MALKASSFIKKGKKDGKKGQSVVDWIGQRRAGLKTKMGKGKKAHMSEEEEC